MKRPKVPSDKSPQRSAWEAHVATVRESMQKRQEELELAAAAASRDKIQRIAAHIVEILAGNTTDVSVQPRETDPAHTRVPVGIPHFQWHKPRLRGQDTVTYNAGDYVAESNPNLHWQAAAFNAGFYAAALAAKEGLLDLDQFNSPLPRSGTDEATNPHQPAASDDKHPE